MISKTKNKLSLIILFSLLIFTNTKPQMNQRSANIEIQKMIDSGKFSDWEEVVNFLDQKDRLGEQIIKNYETSFTLGESIIVCLEAMRNGYNPLMLDEMIKQFKRILERMYSEKDSFSSLPVETNFFVADQEYFEPDLDLLDEKIILAREKRKELEEELSQIQILSEEIETILGNYTASENDTKKAIGNIVGIYKNIKDQYNDLIKSEAIKFVKNISTIYLKKPLEIYDSFSSNPKDYLVELNRQTNANINPDSWPNLLDPDNILVLTNGPVSNLQQLTRNFKGGIIARSRNYIDAMKKITSMYNSEINKLVLKSKKSKLLKV